MPEVAEGTVPIFPTFTGFRSKVTREVDGAGADGGSRFGRAFSGAIAGIATLGIGIKLKDYFLDGIQGASQLEQSVGAVGAIFKEGGGDINKWAKSAQTDVGLTRNEFNELGTLIGAQLKNGGTAMEQLAPKTNDLIGLGADLSSMFGGDTKTAVEALSSALKGERDPIERYGVSLNQAKIDAEAASLGFAKVGGVLSSEANQAATLSLIMKQTADSHGNFAKEADTIAGKGQRLNAMWQDGKTAISNAFLPALGSVQGFLLDKLPGALTSAQSFITNATARVGEFWAGFSAPQDATSSSATLTSFGATAKGVFDRVSEAIAPFVSAISEAIKTGDFSSVSNAFSGFLAIAQPAAPILAEVGTSLGSMSGEVGGLITSGLPLIGPILNAAAGAMQFLSEHTGILTALIVGIAGAMVVYRVAQVAANVASVGAVPAALAQAAANITLASAIRANTTASGAQLIVEKQGIAARTLGAASMLRQAAAGVASRVAMTAGAVATGVATAAQWAWNAAMTANPIGIIIVAIAALVAALVFFFTQTDLGRQVWSNFVSFLTQAWTNIQAVATTVFSAIGAFFSGFWSGLKALFFGAVQGLVNLFLNWTPLGLIISNFGAIVAFFSTMWADVKAKFSEGVTGAVQFVRDLPTKAKQALGNLGSVLLGSGKALIQGFIDGITGMLGRVGDAVGGVMDFVGGFFPHSPAKRGQFAGSGWNRVKTAGLAIGDQFAGGVTGAQSRVSSAMDQLMSVPASNGTAAAQFRASTREGQGDAAGAAGAQINVYPQPGMSEETIGNAAVDRLNYELKKG